jgi:hypothetical protein
MRQSRYHPQESSEGQSTMPMRWWCGGRCGGRKPFICFGFVGMIVRSSSTFILTFTKRDNDGMINEIIPNGAIFKENKLQRYM